MFVSNASGPFAVIGTLPLSVNSPAVNTDAVPIPLFFSNSITYLFGNTTDLILTKRACSVFNVSTNDKCIVSVFGLSIWFSKFSSAKSASSVVVGSPAKTELTDCPNNSVLNGIVEFATPNGTCVCGHTASHLYFTTAFSNANCIPVN